MPLADWAATATFKVIKLQARLKMYCEVWLHDSLGGDILRRRLMLSIVPSHRVNFHQPRFSEGLKPSLI